MNSRIRRHEGLHMWVRRNVSFRRWNIPIMHDFSAILRERLDIILTLEN